MGGGPSKEEEEEKARALAQAQIVDVSSGFHLVELHVPSVGFSTLTIVLLCLVGIAFFAIYKKCRRVDEVHRRNRDVLYGRSDGRSDVRSDFRPYSTSGELFPGIPNQLSVQLLQQLGQSTSAGTFPLESLPSSSTREVMPKPLPPASLRELPLQEEMQLLESKAEERRAHTRAVADLREAEEEADAEESLRRQRLRNFPMV